MAHPAVKQCLSEELFKPSAIVCNLVQSIVLIVILNTFFCEGSDVLRELESQQSTRCYRGFFILVIPREHLKIVILEITSLLSSRIHFCCRILKLPSFLLR